jgi:hypothetical protein
MPTSTVRFSTFPRTESPPHFLADIVAIFERHHDAIATTKLTKGLTSDAVLKNLRADLVGLGFKVEASKHDANKIKRPVFFCENALPSLQYQIDAWHPEWRAGLEIEAGRAWMGNAVYRDLVQALVMVDLNYLVLAVPNVYRYMSSGKSVASNDYASTAAVADALYGHNRIRMPFSLCVIGY